MKSKFIFILPSLALIGFLAIKPPAIGNSTGEVIVTPDATITPAAQPNLRDFDDDGNGPEHDDYDDDDDDYRPKSDLASGEQAPITASTPGAIPMPNLGGGDDDEDDEDDDDHRKGHDDYEDDEDDEDEDESDEDDDH
jgi:hypothetical protein